MAEPNHTTTVVLIHGAWAGSWVWEALTPHLESAGLRVLAVDLPGNGRTPARINDISPQCYVDHVLAQVAEVAEVGGDLVIVGHSGGGVVATLVAEAVSERVRGVVFIAGMMLPPGMGFAELCQQLIADHPEASGISGYLEWSADRKVSRVPPQAARDIFLQDLPDDVAYAAAHRLTLQPESGRALIPQWTDARFGRLPRLYVEATLDRSVVLAAQRRMQALVPGAEVVSLDCGHVPQVAQPEALAAAMTEFIAQSTPATTARSAGQPTPNPALRTPT